MENKIISTNPGKGYQEVGSTAISSGEEIRKAVELARKAFPAWKNLSVKERGMYFEKLIPIFEKGSSEIARMQTREMGKPILKSRGEVKGRIEYIKQNIKLAEKMLEPDVVDESDTQKTTVYFEPFGVVASITPWNYPTSTFFISVTQALLAGNTVVAKGSEECPLTSNLIIKLFEKAGFPEGVIQMVYGNGSVGEFLTDQDVNLIHFTGSSKVGQSIYEKAAKKFIPVVLEMGGSSPGIVFNDVSVGNICPIVCDERFNNTGQICCALKRLFVHKDIFDDFVAKVVAEVKSYVVGDPEDEKTTMGPLVAERQLVVLESQVKDAVDKGAKILTGGKKPAGLNGAYYEPTVIVGVTKDMKVYREEVFGPVLPIMPFKTEEEALKLANDTPYGLSAFVYSSDQGRAKRVAKEIIAGNVSINGADYFTDNAPFGGYKKSGMGSADGKYGYRYVTKMKTVSEKK
ncbi:MAG: aldehyde dehydrogenase [Candidatus Liptonbacteria bacterium]|nr:aldehyde dehydrogenase [Candidatus Liptonbacteria bacterium]